MKNNMLKGICTAAVCIALSTFASTSNAKAASTDPTVSKSFFQDTSGRRSKMSGGMKSGKMKSDSTGKSGNMKGKSSGGYKSKGMGKSKMDTTSTK